MAIASMVCGIVGLFSFFISGINIFYYHQKLGKLGDDLISIVIKSQIDDKLNILYFFIGFSVILIILAFIFGIIERKEGKSNKYYKMANAGFIMGLIGIILQILPVIFVTVSVITFNIMNKNGKSQIEMIDPSSSNTWKRPAYSWYTEIGSVTTKTKDTDKSYTITVVMNLGYDQEDAAASSELSQRQYDLRDFVRRYFTGKYASELQPENEKQLKQEIKEILNTQFFETAKVREIIFDRLDVMEVF